jgi:hypothetical protein
VIIYSVHPLTSTGRLQAEVCDVVTQDITIVAPGQLDFALCMFVLSAMAPQVRTLIFLFIVIDMIASDISYRTIKNFEICHVS